MMTLVSGAVVESISIIILFLSCASNFGDFCLVVAQPALHHTRSQRGAARYGGCCSLLAR